MQIYFASASLDLFESSSNYEFLLSESDEVVGMCLGAFFINMSNEIEGVTPTADLTVISDSTAISIEDNNFTNYMISGVADLTINSNNSITLSASGTLNNGEDFNIFFTGVPDTLSFEYW